MFLKKHIQASGVAEVVIALSIIALCFTVASLVFIRATSAPMRFQDVKTQTEIQSKLLEDMFLSTYAKASSDERTSVEGSGKESIFAEATIDEDPFSDSLEVLTFMGSDQRILWQQQWIKD